MRKLIYGATVLAAVLLVALAAGTWYLRSAEVDPGRDAVLPGLAAPVEVWRDSLAVPHLWARSQADLFRALGYTHAQDRLWQMELLRRLADGRLAEVLGESVVQTDRFLRTLGMGRLAAVHERTLDPESHALLQAYADGVNAWIDGREGALPPEFVALRFQPEPWAVRNTLAVGKIMAWDLAAWSLGLDLQRAVDRVGPERARELFPHYPEWGPHVVDVVAEGAGVDAAASEGVRPPAVSVRAPGVALPHPPALALRLLEVGSTSRASNAWVIGGEHTRSGRPIVANDMHLALQAPSLWYLAALHAPGLAVAGMTIPGAPVVIAGRTDAVAWGFTNAMTDDVDFFVERLHPDDPSRYQTTDGWAPVEVREETIQVRGAAPVVHRIRTTRHGPVLSDVDPRGGDRVLAMRWTEQDPAPQFRALIGMNRAGSAREFLAALRDFRSPHQNVVFADTAGEFGYWMAGRVPLRAGGDGILPAPGWTGEHDWTGYLGWDQHPHVLNPAAGFVVTANNRQAGPEYPHHISTSWAGPYRAQRIRELVEQGGSFTAEDVARQQMDVLDTHARRYLPHALRAAEAAGEADAADLLRQWDARATEDSRAAALFYTWYETLRRRVGTDEYGGGAMYFPREALDRTLDAGGGAWVDDVRTSPRETLPELAREAMRQAVSQVQGQSWGEVHSTRMEHPLGSVGALDRTLGLNVGPFAAPGSPHTVNVSHFGSRPPFVSGYGPSQRHVADLGDLDGSGGFVIPTGQSGLPFSRHYDDQTPLWREGRLWRIPLDRAAASARAVERQRLRPAP